MSHVNNPPVKNSHAKNSAKRKRRRKALPVLGAAGLSLSLAGAPAGASVPETARVPAAGISAPAEATHKVNLTEEEINDVSLATFYVFDRENTGPKQARVRIVVGAGCGCAGCAGCFGCAGGCWTGTYYSSSVFGDETVPPPPPPKHKRAKPAHSSGLAKPGRVAKSS